MYLVLAIGTKSRMCLRMQILIFQCYLFVDDMLAYDELMDMIMFLNPNDQQQFTKYVHEITNYKIKAPL
jgi:hypothetical protein